MYIALNINGISSNAATAGILTVNSNAIFHYSEPLKYDKMSDDNFISA